MPDVNVRSDSVDVEQIMKQIRARIREKRGADYTEAELQQLASVKLEQFADPSGLRSDLLEQFRQRSSEPSTYHRHRGFRRLALMMMHPLLKRVQKQLMADLNLYFEIIHNLVVEVTRLGIEVQNLKMKTEALSSRVDFDERRARSLEGVVQYRQEAPPRPRHQDHGQPRHAQPSQGAPSAFNQPSPVSQPGPISPMNPPSPAVSPSAGSAGAAVPGTAVPGSTPAGQPPYGGRPGDQSPRPDGQRRRRRRRRRRPGQSQGDRMGTAPGGGPRTDTGGTNGAPAESNGPDTDHDDGPDEGGGERDQ